MGTSPISSLVPSIMMKLFIILSVLLHASVEPTTSSTLPCYESIFSFGASFADTGNGNIFLATSSIPNPAAHPPYGQTFFGHPTGRRSNGRLIIDFVAQQLGLPLLPPSLSQNASFSQGANFAVMGSTALDVSFFRDIQAPPIPDSSSSVQLQWFQSLKLTLCSPSRVCPLGFVNMSLFFMGEFGLNDYSYALLGKTLSQVISIVPDMVRAIAESTKGLIKEGATTVVVPGMPPLGCSPRALELFSSTDPADYEPHTGCLKVFNALAVQHNSLLQETLQNVRTNHLNTVVVYADFFSPIIKMVESPRIFGFTEDILMSCCGGGGKYNFNMSANCGMPAATVCKHPNIYLFWDEHFTEATNHYIAQRWLNKLRMQNHLMGSTYRQSATTRDSA